MADTTLYCSRQDLEARLSTAGIGYAADDANSGATDDEDLQRAVDRAIAAAGAEIDAALTTYFSTPLVQDADNRNAWLLERAVDLAAEYLFGRRGAEPPAQVAACAARSRQWLDQVRTGERRVPGLAYPGDAFLLERQSMGLPRLTNPQPRSPYDR